MKKSIVMILATLFMVGSAFASEQSTGSASERTASEVVVKKAKKAKKAKQDAKGKKDKAEGEKKDEHKDEHGSDQGHGDSHQ